MSGATGSGEKVWCVCRRCGAELLSYSGVRCPGCEKAFLEAQAWAKHMSIEDEYDKDGNHSVVVRKSNEPLGGRFCTIHQTVE